tara:strand:+ start:418 stop:621 length:204 start_codon:yes stop_codon:yes gene_type:complete
MISFQIQNIKSCLAWLETCPHRFTITSMQGGFVHVKFFVSEESLSQYGDKENIPEIMEALNDTKIQT